MAKKEAKLEKPISPKITWTIAGGMIAVGISPIYSFIWGKFPELGFFYGLMLGMVVVVTLFGVVVFDENTRNTLLKRIEARLGGVGAIFQDEKTENQEEGKSYGAGLFVFVAALLGGILGLIFGSSAMERLKMLDLEGYFLYIMLVVAIVGLTMGYIIDIDIDEKESEEMDSVLNLEGEKQDTKPDIEKKNIDEK
ncbi:hypothetical protein [Helicobacter sp. T3_23-1059]